MNIIFYIAAIIGLSFLIKDSDGPWGLMASIRNKLMLNKYVGVFFYKLLSCYFCIGCHAGYVIYLLSSKYTSWNVFDFIIWILAGGTFSLIFNIFLDK